MSKEVVQATSTALRQKSKMVEEITPKVEKFAEEMIDFIDSHSKDKNRPIGLSACQLGHSIRMMAFRQNPELLDREDIIILINPEIVYGKGQSVVKETCLSLPGKTYLLKRFKIIKIRGKTLDGTSRSFRARDLLGQVFQHELNHLDGVMIDKIGKLVGR